MKDIQSCLILCPLSLKSKWASEISLFNLKSVELDHFNNIHIHIHKYYDLIVFDEIHLLTPHSTKLKKKYKESLSLISKFSIMITGTLYDLDFSPLSGSLELMNQIALNHNPNSKIIPFNTQKFINIQESLIKSMGSNDIKNPNIMFKIAINLLKYQNDPTNDIRLRKRKEEKKNYSVITYVKLISMSSVQNDLYLSLIHNIKSIFEITQVSRNFFNNNNLKFNILIEFIRNNIKKDDDRLLILLDYINITGKLLYNCLNKEFPFVKVFLLDANTKDLQTQCNIINSATEKLIVLLSFKSGSVGLDLQGCNYIIVYEMVS